MKHIFEPYYVQEYVQVPSGYPPPNHWVWVKTDGRVIRGYFTQRQTSEVLVASAQGIRTHGQFTCDKSEDLTPFTTLRRASDSHWFAIQGDPIVMPDMSTMPYKVFICSITDRPQGDEYIHGFNFKTAKQRDMTDLLTEDEVMDLNNKYSEVRGDG